MDTDPEVPENVRMINMTFTRQSAPETKKLQKLDDIFELNPSQLVDVVFNVFTNREQWQKPRDAKQNAVSLISVLKESKLKDGFPGVSVVKNPLPMQEMQVWSLDGEDPLEEIMATHSSIFAGEIPRSEEPGGLQSMGSQKSQTWLSTHEHA